jgi:hypothetical protein
MVASYVFGPAIRACENTTTETFMFELALDIFQGRDRDE